jgi:hypothetical protein
MQKTSQIFPGFLFCSGFQKRDDFFQIKPESGFHVDDVLVFVVVERIISLFVPIPVAVKLFHRRMRRIMKLDPVIEEHVGLNFRTTLIVIIIGITAIVIYKPVSIKDLIAFQSLRRQRLMKDPTRHFHPTVFRYLLLRQNNF